MSLHGAVTLIAEYAFACASSNTKLKLSEEEMTNLFEKRGYDHNEHSTISLRDLYLTIYFASMIFGAIVYSRGFQPFL
jgi:hypothetical protein